MLVIVAILLLFGVVVRYNWRNALAQKEEILRLVARVSEEEAEIEKLQSVEEYNTSSPPSPPPPTPPPPPPPIQLENRYCCAVCYCPTTTRCSQCKAVRYCSGKCQIIHWRQGHKDDCQRSTPINDSKESYSVDETAWDNQVKKDLHDEPKISSEPPCEVDSGSSSCSLPCFSSSPEQSETSHDTSVSEDLGPGTPVRPDKMFSDSHPLQTTSDSDEADVRSQVPFRSTIYEANTFQANNLKGMPAAKPVKGFQPTNFKDPKAGNETVQLEKLATSTSELRGSHSSSSHKSSSSVENLRNRSKTSSHKAKKFMDFDRQGNHNQVSNIELRNSQFSQSLSVSSDVYWKNEAQICSGKETRSMSVRSSGNYQNLYMKNGSLHNSLSEIEHVPQPPCKGLRSSVKKFVQHFRVSKQSKSYIFDMGEESMGNYNHKIIFPPKIFAQLYSHHASELYPFGLVNSGNSCYANAVLQCLTFTRPITSYLLQGLHSKTCQRKGWCLICEFERLIQKGQEVKSPLSPAGILSQIQRIGSHLSHGREEDAHDFLRNIVDTMQCIWLEEVGVSGSLGENLTLMGLTFGGYLRSKIKCMKCSSRSDHCERMMDLTVEIDGDIYTLEEALARFTISETLGGDDKYKCSRCKSYEKARKKLTILEAPNILTIVLKRFRSGNLEKLNKVIHFPEILDLEPYMSGRADKYSTYQLYAVVVHLNMMNAAYSGHYICYVKDIHGEWFQIDDSRVNRVDRETVLSAEAYILFYARHTPRIPSLVANHSMMDLDVKPKRNMEAISSSASDKKKASKAKPTSTSTKRTPPDYMTMHSLDWGHQAYGRLRQQQRLHNPLIDWSSDTSSIFSTSDTGSCSTDSTKDSSADDISGYLFGSTLYHHR
ncbi:ubiquitin carboxyl-terminal hydrolase 17-like [Andrographis paniculata]|uniref:ubiquitin carboxyl-terminal hydrolase 17-like n=1 Tax=Andrographis paniculata TaxID=175694 RepID=UPI0021E9ABD0|nr:ubiquitin carboxyl-terminal hydrolase 17-like [Andrographis paniculata]